MTGFEEKRNTPRANVKLNIRMAQENVDSFGEYYALNISAGGIYIETKYPLALGTKLKLDIRLKDGTSIIRGKGEVVWSSEGSEGSDEYGSEGGMGIRFKELDEASKKIVEEIVKANLDNPEGADGMVDIPADLLERDDPPPPEEISVEDIESE